MYNILDLIITIIYILIVIACFSAGIYLLSTGIYLSFFKFKKPLNKPIDTSLECAPNKIIVLKGVSYKCIIQQHDSVDRCLQCSLNSSFADCLSVNCMPEVKGVFKFYILLKQ